MERATGMKNMGRKAVNFVVAQIWVILGLFAQINGQPIVPALILFGDSSVDVGNNIYIPTLFKANYPPYGRDFAHHMPTGRFCNGKLTTDFTAETLGFTSFPAAYLSPHASGTNLLIGTNFGSSAAGFDDRTSTFNIAISMARQLEYFKEYQVKLAKVAGSVKAKSILTDAIYLISCGSADFMRNYYINPSIKEAYTPGQYASFLVTRFTRFVKDLHGLGARRIGVISVPPHGCVPALIAAFGSHGKKECVETINNDIQRFNKEINSTVTQLNNQLPGVKLVVLDIYKPYYDLVHSPSQYGFTEARRGCCATGSIKDMSFMCKPNTRSCRNASEYVFWDGVHLTEAANEFVVDQIFIQAIGLVA